jgi:hypothetical protein
MKRSILAFVASFLTVVVLSIVTDVAMGALGILPPPGAGPATDGALAIATGYRSLYAVLGAYIVARLAPNRPMGHALLSGLIGVVLSTVGAVVTWNAGPAYGPKWYPLSLIATALPCAWIGGKLWEKQR